MGSTLTVRFFSSRLRMSYNGMGILWQAALLKNVVDKDNQFGLENKFSN